MPTVEVTRIDQEVAGQALTTDRLFVHTYARLWPALDVNLDLGRQQRAHLLLVHRPGPAAPGEVL